MVHLNDNVWYGNGARLQICNFYHISDTETVFRYLLFLLQVEKGLDYFQSRQYFPLMLSHAEVYIFFFSSLHRQSESESGMSHQFSLSASQLTI